MVLPIALALVAGALTTVAGLGGGMVLLLGLSLWWDPITALAVTSPALLVGNLHRLALYRDDLDRGVARRYVLGALPGSVVGGLFAVAVPALLLQGLMLASVAFAWAQHVGAARIRPPAGAVGPAGALIGFVAATGGGAGLLAGPLLLSTGLCGRRYVATAACGALSMHVGRLAAYGVGGIVDADVLLRGCALAIAVTVGNLVGDRARAALPERALPRVEIGVLVACAGLSVAGLA